MDISNWQERTELLLDKSHKKLKSANILIVGLGGVGGIASEMLCRAGIGKMTIVDGDEIDITNLNRQIFTTKQYIGKRKAPILADKLLSINENLELKVIDKYIKDNEMVELLEAEKYDYVIDAIDTLSPKVFLIYHSVQMNIPVVSSMGSGGKLNPTMVKVDDISKSYNCPLARIVRKRLHKLGVRKGLKVVYSPEKRIESSLKFIEAENKKTTLGTISYMPNIFGIYCSWVVVHDLIA